MPEAVTIARRRARECVGAALEMHVHADEAGVFRRKVEVRATARRTVDDVLDDGRARRGLELLVAELAEIAAMGVWLDGQASGTDPRALLRRIALAQEIGRSYSSPSALARSAAWVRSRALSLNRASVTCATPRDAPPRAAGRPRAHGRR